MAVFTRFGSRGKRNEQRMNDFLTPCRQEARHHGAARPIAREHFARRPNLCLFSITARAAPQCGPFGGGSKSPPNASRMLDGGRRRLALFSCSEAISIPTQFRVPILDRPWPGLLDVGRYEEQTSPVVRCSFAAVRSLDGQGRRAGWSAARRHGATGYGGGNDPTGQSLQAPPARGATSDPMRSAGIASGRIVERPPDPTI